MISPFRFYWSKIMPISYENYLSETEILEALRTKVNALVETVNKINVYIDDTLDAVIDSKVKAYTKDIDLSISEIKTKLANLDSQIDALETAVKKSKDDIMEIRKDIEKINSALTSLENEFLTVWETIARIEKNLADSTEFLMSYSNKNLALARAEWVTILSNLRRYFVSYVRKMFSELSGETVYVYNDGIRMPLQEYVDSVEMRLDNHLSRGLTAYEFDQTGLTVYDFDALALTAWQFDNFGLDYDYWDTDSMIKLGDMSGYENINPVPTVYSAIANPIRAGDIDNFGFTCAEMDNLNYDTYSHDRWGEYLYSLLSVPGGISAGFFDSIGYTADEFDSLGYTVTDFDTMGSETAVSGIISGLIGFDSVELSGESYVTSEFFTTECSIGYTSIGQILSDISLKAFHPDIFIDFDSDMTSDFTVVKDNSYVRLLNKRLSDTKTNTILVDGYIKPDLLLQDNSLSFANLPVLINSTGNGLTVSVNGSTRSKVIKI